MLIVISENITSTVGSETKTDDAKPLPCCGFSLQHIRKMKVGDERKVDLFKGFGHAVRNGFRVRGDLSKLPPDAKPVALDQWSQCFAPPVVGALTKGNDINDVRWRIEEQQRSVGTDQFEYISIHAVGCKGDTIVSQGLCGPCAASKKRLIDQFDSAVQIRENPLHPKTNNIALNRNHSTQNEKIQKLTKQNRNLAKKVAHRQNTLPYIVIIGSSFCFFRPRRTKPPNNIIHMFGHSLLKIVLQSNLVALL